MTIMNNVNDLRETLFDTMQMLKDGDEKMDLDKAKTIEELAQVIINSAKVEVDFLKQTGNENGTGFLNAESPKQLGAPVPVGFVPYSVKAVGKNGA